MKKLSLSLVCALLFGTTAFAETIECEVNKLNRDDPFHLFYEKVDQFTVGVVGPGRIRTETSRPLKGFDDVRMQVRSFKGTDVHVLVGEGAYSLFPKKVFVDASASVAEKSLYLRFPVGEEMANINCSMK